MLKRSSEEAGGNRNRVTRQELSFPKRKRLVSDRQFKAALDRNLRFSDGLLTLYMAENDCGYPRLGVSVGKACGKAVVRNRLKRLLREAFRQNQGRIPAGFDYLLMVSRSFTKSNASLRSGNSLRSTSKSADFKNTAKENLRQLTFEQVKASFLALVTAAAGKI